jgi:hypothetical protein
VKERQLQQRLNGMSIKHTRFFLPLDAEPFLYGDEIFIPTVLAEQPSGLLKTRIAIKRFLPEDKLCLS